MTAATDAAAAAPSARRRGARIGSGVASYLGFVPAILLLGLCFLVPFGIIVCYSFWETIDYAVVHHWTLDNYRYFFSVSAYVSTMWWTLVVAVIATAFAIGLAFPFAYWLSRYSPKRLRTVLLVLVIVPFWSSYLLRVYSWLTILGQQGIINRFLQWAGITNHPLGVFLYDRPAVILVLVYLYFPFGALTLYSSIDNFDWNQLRAAMDLGASPLQAIFRILVPQIKPGIITAIIFVFIPILGEYLTPPVPPTICGVMIGNLIANFFQEAEYTRGAAISLLVAAFIVLLLVIFRKSLSAKEAYGA